MKKGLKIKKTHQESGFYFRTYTIVVLLILLLFNSGTALGVRMYLDSYTGPVTANEINQFKTFMATRTPAVTNVGNAWVYGNSGMDTEAMGIMFEITGDIWILDRMIQFCDVALYSRNDILPAAAGGQRIIWTGNVEPVWPNNLEVDPPGGVAFEQGDIVGHINYCSLLILQNPSIWNVPVSVGDPYGWGSTYLARAQTYINRGDETMSQYVIPWFVDESGELREPDDPRWLILSDRNEANKASPWNQQAMTTNGFLRLAQCHELLGDNPSVAAEYRNYVQVYVDWFFNCASTYAYTAPEGVQAYFWAYTHDRVGKPEDTAHANYDVWGLLRAYEDGNFNLTRTRMNGIANTIYYVIYDDSIDLFHKRVDGTDEAGESPSNTCQPSFINYDRFLPNPDLYYQAYPDIFMLCAKKNREYGREKPIYFARTLYEKHLRYLGVDTDPPTPNPATFASVPAAFSGTEITMTATLGADLSGPIEYLFTETSGNRGGTSSGWQTSASYTDSGLNPSTQYTYTVTMRDSLGNTGTASVPANARTDDLPSHNEPLAHWKLDDGSGTTATDSSGNGYDGTITGASWVSGQDGGALDFTASSGDTVSIPSAAFGTVSDAISIAFWANGDAAVLPVSTSVLYAVDASGYRVLNIHLPWSNGAVYWDAGNSGTSSYDRIYKTAAESEYEGQWNHWVFTKDAVSGEMNIYLNGVLWHSGTGKTRTMGRITAANIGSRLATDYYYDGALDDVRVYNWVLCPKQIIRVMNNSPDGDVNGDGGVNLTDLAHLCDQWLSDGSSVPSADIWPACGDGLVDLQDFALLGSSYLMGTAE